MFKNSEVISSALSSLRTWLDTITSNIANAETTRTADGGPYKRKDVVLAARTVTSSFSNELDGTMKLARPQVAAVVEDNSPAKKVLNPGHPDADKDGYVSMPNINVVSEMTNLMTVQRAYEANISLLRNYRSMVEEAKKIIQA